MPRVLVTGAASGIGAAIAGHLAELDWQVTRSDIQDGEGIAALDVTNESDWTRALDRGGPFDAVVNSAGVRTRGPFVDTSLDEWNRVVGINLTGTFLGLREFAKSRIAAGKPGAFLAIASVNSFSAVVGQPHYVASKAGVAMLIKAAALEFAPHNIRVNAIAPGPIDTPMLAERLAEPSGRTWLEEKVPLRRIGTVADCAAAAAFLLSDEASFITGVSLPVDGGWLTQ